MAIVQKVIVLNKPFKIFGFTFIQWIILVVTALIGLWVGTFMPQVKFNGIQLGIWVTIITPCLGLLFVNASSIKPWQWWRNRILSVSNLMPTEMLPKPQPARTYPEEDTRDDAKQL